MTFFFFLTDVKVQISFNFFFSEAPYMDRSFFASIE